VPKSDVSGIITIIKTTSVGDATVSVTEVGVAGWAWSLHGKMESRPELETVNK